MSGSLFRYASCPPSFRRIGDFIPHQYGGQFWVNLLLYQALGSPKKAPPPTGMVELLCDQLETDMGHCDLFQWHNCLAPSIFQSEIRLDGVSNQRHMCFLCNGNQNVTKPFQKRNAKTRGREERAGLRSTSFERNLIETGLTGLMVFPASALSR